MSYGTEDRRTGAEFFPPNPSLYDYILFRGSDVKDLRIEEGPKESAPQQPPNDPAILGVSRFHFFGMVFSLVMKNSGCKSQCPRAQKPCGYFRCLPSDRELSYAADLRALVGLGMSNSYALVCPSV
jgi:hypothetical protein